MSNDIFARRGGSSRFATTVRISFPSLVRQREISFTCERAPNLHPLYDTDGLVFTQGCPSYRELDVAIWQAGDMGIDKITVPYEGDPRLIDHFYEFEKTWPHLKITFYRVSEDKTRSLPEQGFWLIENLQPVPTQHQKELSHE